jgi:hypothetical protein
MSGDQQQCIRFRNLGQGTLTRPWCTAACWIVLSHDCRVSVAKRAVELGVGFLLLRNRQICTNGDYMDPVMSFQRLYNHAYRVTSRETVPAGQSLRTEFAREFLTWTIHNCFLVGFDSCYVLFDRLHCLAANIFARGKGNPEKLLRGDGNSPV